MDVFDELNEINVAVITKDGKIQRINFAPLLEKLHIRAKGQRPLIQTPLLLDFMSSLKGSVKSSGKNGISRLQTFLNAYIQENALVTSNDNVTYINDDHDYLVRGGHGEDASDLMFTASDGKTYKLEAKMYWDESSFRASLPNTNFHNADYVCLFFMHDPNYHWAFARKEDNYTEIYRLYDLRDSDPQLFEIRLPGTLSTISINVDKDATDAEVPEEVDYRFFTN